jgi:hypothetical protein
MQNRGLSIRLHEKGDKGAHHAAPPPEDCNHTFRVKGFTAYLKNGGTLETRHEMANLASRADNAALRSQRRNSHGVVGELGSHSFDNEIDKGFRSIKEEFSVGIASNFRLHAVRLGPSRQALKVGARRLA